MANSEAVAYTPQPHIGEAYVGIKCSKSTMYRGAVPITEHLPADVLEPRCGTGWRGASRPHKGTTLRPLRLPCAPCHCGAGGMQNRSAVSVILIFVGAMAAYLLSYNKLQYPDNQCIMIYFANYCPDGTTAELLRIPLNPTLAKPMWGVEKRSLTTRTAARFQILL